MKKLYFVLFILSLFASQTYSNAQIVINELQLENKTTIADDDFEFHPWIEIFNAGNSAVNLQNYSLSDDPLLKTKWKFPYLTIAAKGRMVIFLSGKNTMNYIDHWESVVYPHDIWKYTLTDTAYNNSSKYIYPLYDDSGWKSGKGGIGLGDNDDSTIIKAAKFYTMRKVIKLKNKNFTNLKKAFFQIDNENQCYVYFNGTMVSSYMYNAHDHLRNGLMPKVKSTMLSIFTSGFNSYDSSVLSIRFFNASDSLHHTAIPYLTFGYSDTVTHVFNNRKTGWFKEKFNYIHANFRIKNGESIYLYNNLGALLDTKTATYNEHTISYARIPDGGSWCITDKPTPDTTNNSSTCFTGILEPPVFAINSGFVKSGQMVFLSTVQPNCIIKYTTNGNIPNNLSKLYTNGVKVNADMVVRAICIDTTHTNFMSKSATNTYLLNNKSHKLPIVSIASDSLDLFDANSGIYAKSGNAPPYKRATHLEYMLPSGKTQFELDADISIHGNGSRGMPKKSLRIETNDKYDSSFIKYKLFPNRWYNNITAFNLRSGSQDQGMAFMRDELCARMMLNSNIETMEHQSCVVYLNGAFWGEYHIREKQDNDYVQNVKGVDKDSIDIINLSAQAIYGNTVAFQKLNAMYQDSLNTQAKVDSLNKYLDVKSWCDYIAFETFIHNTDWPGNNTKHWRPHLASGGKFRYMLYDMDYSMNDTSDKLKKVMGFNYFGTNTFTKNINFRNYFVNRYADLLNTSLSLAIWRTNITIIKNNMLFDMDKEKSRWGGTTQQWIDRVSDLDTFVRRRLISSRVHLVNNFGLTKQVNLTLNIYPAGAGVVKLNTIIPTNYPWTGIYFDGVPVTVTAIPNPGYTFDSLVINNVIKSTSKTFTQNLSQNANTINFYFNGSPTLLKITTTEINYNNNSYINCGNWIELHNNDTVPVDMTGFKLKTSKDYAVYEFKDNYIFPANAYLVICEDTVLFKKVYPGVKNFVGNIGFSLNNSSDSIVLITNKQKRHIGFVYADTLPWPICADGTGRTMEIKDETMKPNLNTNWFNGCIGGSPGKAYTPCNESVIISEINYNPKSSHDNGDWIELYNQSASTVNVSGWHFKDDDDTHDFVIPNNTFLLPNKYLVIYNDTAKFRTNHPTVTNKVGPFNFGLSSSGEMLRLFDNKMYPKFSMVYFNETKGWPLLPNGEGYTLEINPKNTDFSNKINWITGCKYGSPGMPRDICPEDIVLVPTEINYKSLPEIYTGDWLELRNNSKDTINIYNWKLKTKTQTYTFTNITILPKDFIVVTENAIKFSNALPLVDKSKIYQMFIDLNDTSESITIYNNNDIKCFEMNFVADSNDKWANGIGYTLELQKMQSSYKDYSITSNWKHGCFLGNPLDFGNACPEKISVSEVNYNSDSLNVVADWLELYNYGTRPVNLNGYRIITNSSNSILNENYILSPKARLLVTADSTNIRTQFGLSSKQLAINLKSLENIRIANIDNNFISQAIYDSSTLFFTNGLGKTVESKVDSTHLTAQQMWTEGCFGGSPGAAFSQCKPLDIVLSEINYAPNSKFNTGKWFELTNIDSLHQVDLSNYYISFGDISKISQFDSTTSFQPMSKSVFISDTTAFKFYFPFAMYKYPFKDDIINSGWVRIWDPSKKPVFAMKFDNSFGGNNNGKTISLLSSSYNLMDYSKASNWQEGCLGGSPGIYNGWCDTSLLVSEINYQSSSKKDGGDWFELWNPTSTIIDLNGMHIVDNNNQSFNLSGLLLPDSVVAIISDSAKFNKVYPAKINRLDKPQFSLANNGNIRIFNANQSLIYVNQWDNKQPWNDSADGKGYTLEYIDSAIDFNSANSWFIGCEGGSPGIHYTPCIIEDTTHHDTTNTGMNIKEYLSNVSIHPNPSTGIITLHLPDQLVCQLSVYSATGALVYKPKGYIYNSQTIDLSGLSKGIYVLVISDELGRLKTIKFIKE